MKEKHFQQIEDLFPIEKGKTVGIAKNNVNQMLKLKHKHTIVVLSVQKV